MNIILCIFLLNITAVSVFGQSVELHGIVGQSVKFPAAVEKRGFLMYGSDPIGEVDSGSFRASRNENYRERVQWDNSTGLFSLSGLKMEDIGEYKVQNTDQNINTVFQLNVHEDNVPVSKPHLNVTHNEYRCTILCAAVRGTGVTLTLYREGEKKPYVTSPVRSHPHLDLPVPVESGTYTCEARNSVSRETSDPLTVEAHCTAPSGSRTWLIVVLSVVVAVVTLIAGVFVVCYCRNGSKHSTKEGFIRRFRGNRSKHSTKEGNRSKHSTKEGNRSKHSTKEGETRLELSPHDRRTLIRVDKLLNDSLPAYDEELLNVGLPTYGDAVQPVPQSD